MRVILSRRAAPRGAGHRRDEQDLAEDLARVEQPVRVAGAVERQPGVHDGPQAAVGEHRPRAGAHVGDDALLLGQGPRAQGGADDAGPAGHEQPEVELPAGPALRPDHDEPAARGQGGEVGRQPAGAEHVEHHVRAVPAGRLPDGGDDVLGAVVDDGARAEPAAALRPLGAAGGGDHVRAECGAQLDRDRPDAPGTALHQQHLARDQASGVHHVRPRCEQGLRQPGGVHQVDLARDGQQQTGRHRDRRGVPAAGEQRRDARAQRPGLGVGAGAVTCDDTGDLEARPGRGAGRRRVLPLTLEQVRAVHPGGRDPHQYLARTRDRVGSLDHPELLGTTGDLDLDHLHRASLRTVSSQDTVDETVRCAHVGARERR
jgi:hypothetical protein